MDKSEFIANLRSERAKLERLFEAVGTRRMDIAGVSGLYSTKDVIAHLTGYELTLVKWLKEARGGRVYVDAVLDQPDVDARNVILYQANKSNSAADIVRTFQETFDELEECVRLVQDDELTNADLTAWFVVPRWHRKQELWRCIANDSYEHHDQHISDIERWLEENSA